MELRRDLSGNNGSLIMCPALKQDINLREKPDRKYVRATKNVFRRGLFFSTLSGNLKMKQKMLAVPPPQPRQKAKARQDD